MMHAALIANSPRLQRAATLLADGRWHSTREIIEGANVCAVSSCAAELRANGLPVETEWRGHVCYYRRPTEMKQGDLFL